MTTDAIILAVQQWVEKAVISLNLCPFAKRELKQARIRFVHCEATTETTLLSALEAELAHLDAQPEVETTLLIHPDVLKDFTDYNDFLDIADALITNHDLEGIYQIASFHPHYQFAGTSPNDPENYTNRSPYPLLHILREASLEAAIANYPDPDAIPTRNIALMNEMGIDAVQNLLKSCYQTTPTHPSE